MQEWKIRQEVFHKLKHDFKDDLNKIEITLSHDLKNNALRHFYERVDEWIYPAKSYVVAFCYAYWISQDFQEDFRDLLMDPDLLYGNDPYYKTYDESPEVYEFLLDNIDFPIPMEGMIPDIREYYEEEFFSMS